MPTRFSKMHGAGNDFVLLDLRGQTFSLDGPRVKAMADRATGIGFDQLLVLHAASSADVPARFAVFNADGSRAEQCGNGVRCIGLYLQRRGEAPDGPFELQGPAGNVTVTCLPDGQVQVDMGEAQFDPQQIPTTLAPKDGLYSLPLKEGPLSVGAVSMGNPHVIVQVEDTEKAPVASLGPAIGAHPAFPQGCNVGFMQVQDRHTLRLRVFERGSGETLACGSGACAAAAHALRQGLVENPVHVRQAGGLLIIDLDPTSRAVRMTGPAVHVFEGTLE